MDLPPRTDTASRAIASLLLELEELSRSRPDRVLRLRGTLTRQEASDPGEDSSAGVTSEPFELLIFRGFSSLTTHPTDFDPDRPALPEGSRIDTAELLQGPLNPSEPILLAGPMAVETLLRPEAWH